MFIYEIYTLKRVLNNEFFIDHSKASDFSAMLGVILKTTIPKARSLSKVM